MQCAMCNMQYMIHMRQNTDYRLQISDIQYTLPNTQYPIPNTQYNTQYIRQSRQPAADVRNAMRHTPYVTTPYHVPTYSGIFETHKTLPPGQGNIASCVDIRSNLITFVRISVIFFIGLLLRLQCRCPVSITGSGHFN